MWNLADGYVIIQISEGQADRFLNRMRAESFALWDVCRTGGAIQCRIRARDFRRLRPIRRACRCRVRIVARTGLPFFITRLQTRMALWIGCALALACFCLLTTRIWVIPITGCETLPEQVVARALREQGIYPGASKRGLVLYRVAELARLYDDRIAMIELDLDGIVCLVDVEEAKPIGQTIDRSVPTDVLAAKGGVISRIEPFNGAANVAVGQAVSAGDVLIRGDITAEDATEPLLVHAYGNVFALVNYFAEAAVSGTYEALAPSGRTEPYKRITVAGIPMFETRPSFEHYVLSGEATSGALGTLLPVRVTTGTLAEQTMQAMHRSEEACIEQAMVEAERRAYEKLPTDGAIVDKQTTFALRDGCVIGICCIVMEESIGYTKEIGN